MLVALSPPSLLPGQTLGCYRGLLYDRCYGHDHGKQMVSSTLFTSCSVGVFLTLARSISHTHLLLSTLETSVLVTGSS